MKVLNTYICKHKVDGVTKESRVIAVLEQMEKDGNTYEYIKTYKLDKDCPTPNNGTTGKLLFTFGKNPRAIEASYTPRLSIYSIHSPIIVNNLLT